MRRERLSRLAARLRYALLQNPAISESPRCTRCGMLVRPAGWSKREDCCVGCETDPMMWDDSDPENARPFLPEEEL